MEDPAGPTGSAPSEPTPRESEEGEHKEEGETALLPRTILQGKDFKPGEEVVLKIVRIMDDQIEVAYATGEEKGGEASGPSANEEIDAMAGGGGY